MRRQTCNAIGCRAAILPTELFCHRHEQLLESDTRTLLGKLFRPGQRPSQRFLDALDHARREILFFATNGHRMPRDAAFEW